MKKFTDLTIDKSKYACRPYNKGIVYTYIGSYKNIAIFQNDTTFLAEDVCIEFEPHRYLPFMDVNFAKGYIDRKLAK